MLKVNRPSTLIYIIYITRTDFEHYFSQLFWVRVVLSRWTFYKKCLFRWDTKKVLYLQNWWTIPSRKEGGRGGPKGHFSYPVRFLVSYFGIHSWARKLFLSDRYCSDMNPNGVPGMSGPRVDLKMTSTAIFHIFFFFCT